MSGETLTFKLWRWVITGAALWWCLGLNLFIYHICAFMMFMGMIYMSNRNAEGLYIPTSCAYILCIASFYLLSILIHAVFVGVDTQRMVAALYNLSFWLMGFMLIMTLANAYTSGGVLPYVRTFSRLAFFTGAIAVAMLVLWKTGRREVIIETPLFFLTKILGRTQLVESSLLMRPLLMDWFASAARPRFNVFSPYPTAAGGIIVITVLMMASRAAMERHYGRITFLALMGTNLLGLFLTLSRMSILALAASAVAIFLLQKKRISIWLIVTAALLALVSPLIVKVLEYMLSLREGSNSIRMELYLYSLQQLRGADWILGFGVKPRGEAFIFPLGSHSTYISMLFKCGLVGLISLIGFQVSLFWRWYRIKPWVVRYRRDFFLWRGLGAVFIAMGLWIITEDIDAPQLLSFLYFSSIGVFEGLRKKVLS